MFRLFKPLNEPEPKLWQRFISFFLVISLIFGLVPFSFDSVKTAEAASPENYTQEPEITYGLIAIVVDNNLLDNSNKYDGLSGDDYSSISKTTIKNRIERYSEDIQKESEYTKTLILGVDTTYDSVPDIASTLEKLYFDGDGTADQQNNLIGIVLVGDVPLPVVNKNGNRFISMLPYTDFVEKSYIYNSETGDYEKDERVNFPKVEAWHGVIKAPEELNGDDKNEALARYFDKNHLYHTGNEDFAEFEKGILISDLYHEKKLMNTGFFKYYEKYIENAEDNTYLRINKHWAEKLYNEFVGDLKAQAGDVLSDEYKDSLDASGGMFDNLPDIQSKYAVIDKYHMPYYKLFSKYAALVNDWVSYTGRYEKENAQSVVELISTKDAYTYAYLREVNTAFENQLDSMVKKALQKHIPIISNTNLTGNILVKVERTIADGTDDDKEPDKVLVDQKLPFSHRMRQTAPMISGSIPDESNLNAPLFSFLNHSLIEYAAEKFPETLATTQKKELDPTAPPEPPKEEMYEMPNGTKVPFLDQAPKLPTALEEEATASLSIPDAENRLYINGIQAKDIQGPLDCSLYRGSTQITYNNRIYNVSNAGKKLFFGATTKPILFDNNEDYGVLVTSDPYISSPAVIKDSPLDKAGIKEGDIILEINDKKLNKPDINGSRLLIEDIVPNLDVDDQKTISIKYYSASEKKEVGPIDISLEDRNSEKWSAGCNGTNGIKVYEDGSDNANKCVPALSRTPVFDAGAGTEISEDDLPFGKDVDTAHILSCYDFFYNEEPLFVSEEETTVQPFVAFIKAFKDFNSYVSTNFLNPTKKFEYKADTNKTDEKFHNLASNIVLFNEEFASKKYELTFADILKHAGIFDGIDNDNDGEVDEEDEDDINYAVNEDDWAEIGQRVLARSGTFKFYVDEVGADVEITIEPNVVKLISSMIPHKEPVNSTIAAQSRAQSTKSLPIDEDRYIAFLDKNGILQKLYYPNAFDSESREDFQLKLFKLANDISKIPGSEKLLPSDSDEDLTTYLFNSFDSTIAAKDELYKKDETGHKYLTETQKDKFEDAVYWKNLGIDDKHSYVLESYLNPQKKAYADEHDGYEALYLVSDGEEDFASFGFYGDYEAADAGINAHFEKGPDSYEDALSGSGEAVAKAKETLTTYNPPLGPEQPANSDEAVPLAVWFPEMAKWIKETVESLSAFESTNLSLSCPVSQEDDIIDAITEGQNDLDVEDKTIAKLSIELDKDVVRAGGADTARLIVKSLNENGDFINDDSKTRVKLIIAPEGQNVIVTDSEDTYLSNGLGLFRINPTEHPGKITIQVRTLNTPGLILSNSVILTTTKRSLRLNTFESGTDINDSGEEESVWNASNAVQVGGNEMRVDAVMLDDEGLPLLSGSGSNMSFKLIQDVPVASLSEDPVLSKDGVASTIVKSTKIAGPAKLEAEIKNSLYPKVSKDIFIMPGPLDKISVLPKSNIIKTGGVSYTPIRIQLEDEFGNIKNDEMYELTIWHDGPGEFKNIHDQNDEKDGIQIFVNEGVLEFDMSSTDKQGQVIIHAETDIKSAVPSESIEGDDTEVDEAKHFYSSTSIDSRHNVILSASSKALALKADGETKSIINVDLVGGNTNGANLPINISISNENLAYFPNPAPTELKDGKAKTFIQSKSVSGDFSVTVSSPGFEDIIIPIEVKALEPYAVQLIKPEENLVSDGKSMLNVEAQILDKYGNFVKDDIATKIHFSVADSTKNTATILSSPNLLVQGGKAIVTVKSTLFSGPVKIYASGKGLKQGDDVELSSEKRMLSESFASSNPKVLFASMIGNAFGDITKKNNIASGMLFGEGKSATESISATTAPLEQFKTLFLLDASGAAKNFDESSIQTNYAASDNIFSSDRVTFTYANTGTLLGEAAVVLPDVSFVQVGEAHDKPGVYLSNFTEDKSYKLKEVGGDMIILKDEIPQVRISSKGQIKLLSRSNLSIAPLTKDTKYLSFRVKNPIADIVDVALVPQQGKDVNKVDASYKFSGDDDGVYLIMHSKNSDFRTREFFSGNSTLSARAYAIEKVGEPAPDKQVIGGPHASLEAGFDRAGIGFTGQNKHMLLFFSGNSVGESFVPYASESGIVLGDPTVKLKDKDFDEASGFNDDLGQSVYTDQESIQSFKTFDYNSDGIDDVLIAFEDGKVKLLEGLMSSQANPFKDKGYLLNLVNGIFDLDVGDINNDGQDDIVVATRESCNVGETCVYFYRNDKGHFIQENAGLNLEEKVSDLEVDDMNKDGFDDLVVADLNRNVSIFYGSETGLSVHGDVLGGLQPQVDEGLNTAHQTFISYARTSSEEEKIRASIGFDPFIPMTLPSNNPNDSTAKDKPLSAEAQNALADLAAISAKNGAQISIAPVQGKKLHQFLPLDRDLRVNKSIKKVKDVNGEYVKGGDKLDYTITIFNEGSSIFNASILDYVPESFDFNEASIDCEGCSSEPQIIETGISTRPYLISGLNIDKNKLIKITYSVNAATFPPLQIMLGTDFDDYPDDEYLDVMAFPEGTPLNRVVYYSDGKNSQEKMNYKEKFPTPKNASDLPVDIEDPQPTAEDLGFTPIDPKNPPHFDEDSDSDAADYLLPDSEAKKDIGEIMESIFVDGDVDGIPDLMDWVSGGLNEVAGGIEKGMSALRCSGGCIPSPVNMTVPVPFPVPGKINIFGVPGPYVPGVPIFAIAKPSTLAPPAINTVVWPAGNPYYFESVFRMYMAPTLTGGLGTAFCLGDYPWTDKKKTNSCLMFAIPVLEAIGVCKVLADGIQSTLDGINSFQKGTGLTTVTSKGSNPQTASNEKKISGFSSGPYPVSASVAANVRIPGFPSTITNWLDRQTEEIIDKLTDLPDIYLITPTFDSAKNSVLPQGEIEINNMHDIYRWLNSIPLVRIEQKPVMIKIPWLYSDEVEKLIRESEQWKNNLEKEWKKFKEVYKCDLEKTGADANNICNKLSVSVPKLVSGIEKNIQALESYRELPKKLITFRHLEAQYVRQVVCYLDTIIQYTSGYMEKQGTRVSAWIAAAERVKRILEDWKVIVDISVTYAESCDACKSDRFSLLEILMKFLVVVPDPPIMELPKWPDIVLDVSQIQAGATIVMPEFVFVPEPLVLPQLPKFELPYQMVPDVNIILPSVPSLPVIPDPFVFLPELPSLPPLPLPDLPDIPPPPDIPELPKPVFQIATTLNSIFKIICLVKQGLLPLPETNVSGQFETLTQRGISPMLPIDFSASFQLPPFAYSYVDKIEVIGKLNFQLDMDIIYNIVNSGAEVANAFSDYGIDYANKKLQEGSAYPQILNPGNYTIPGYENMDIDLSIPGNEAGPPLKDALSSFDENLNEFEKNLIAYTEQVKKINEYSHSLPDNIVVNGSSTMIDTSHPIFDHSIDDVKERIALNADEVAPSNLLAMRDNLIAYYDNLENGTSQLRALSNGEFFKFIAEDTKRPLLADSNFNSSGKAVSEIEFNTSNESTFENLSTALDHAKEIQNRLIALTDENTNNSSTENGGSPKGMFIYDEEKNINQALISYTEELDSVSHIAYIDADQDGDEDILYSFGGDIYLKRNYTNNNVEKLYKGSPVIANLSKYFSKDESINYLSTTFTSNQRVGLSWDPSISDNLKAYELLIKYDFEAFENEEDSPGSIVHLIEEVANEASVMRPDYYKYSIEDGDLFINSEEAGDSEGVVKPGDFLSTSEDLTTEIDLNAYNDNGDFLGTIKLGSSTAWLIEDLNQNPHEFGLNQGEIIFDFNETTHPLLAANDSISTGDARVLIEYSDDESFLVNENQDFLVPDRSKVPIYVSNLSLFSDAKITSNKRFVTTLAAGVLDEGTIIHFIEDSTINAKEDGTSLFEITQAANTTYTVPSGLPKNTIFYVDSGKIEVIFPEASKNEYDLEEGMAIMPGDFVSMKDGVATLNYTDSLARVDVNKDQIFTLLTYDDPSAPTADIELLNGSYYGMMRSVMNDNGRGTSSLPLILAPQSCGDNSAPYISVSETEKNIAVFKTATIDASSSFDAAGSIVAYYADTNLGEDSDGDGDPTNDKNQFSDLPQVDLDDVCFKNTEMDNPVFNFGPYDIPGRHNVKIFAVDQSCNVSGQVVTINVFVPQIFLDPMSAKSGKLTGHIEPVIKDMPLSFIRDRKPPIEMFKTESADENGKYYTDAFGEFTIDDLDTNKSLSLSDSNGQDIAEIDSQTGNIKLINNQYRVEILAALPPDLPTRAVVLDKEGKVMASFFIVPDLNSDTEIVDEFASDNNSVQIKLTNNSKEFEFNVLPANHQENPGATEIKYGDKVIALINSSGNIFSFDDGIQLIVTNHKDGIYEISTISIYFNGKEIAQVYLPSLNNDGNMETIPERDLNKINAVGVKPIAHTVSDEKSPFSDVDETATYADAILDLAQKGIVDGYNENGQLLYKPDKLISRAEYTKILLRTLCIEPSEEAYKGLSPFSDIHYVENNVAWFYPFVKESYLQDFIQGYVGEKDPETGKSPFKPANTISRAEAATILLSALNKLEIMDLSSIQPGDPWYAPFMEVSKNLSPYLKEAGENSNVFLLTDDESSDPQKQISRAEFAVMAQRVFSAYNCFEIDEDNDGMPTQWEKDNNLNPYDPSDAAKDPDKDELTNLEEYQNNTDPYNPDSDGGCMLDGKEVKAGFNPANNPDDDDPDFDGLSCNAEKNIYNTDPFKADTDNGGINDGIEVLKNNTNPLNGGDDAQGEFADLKTELSEGIYAIEPSCKICPCPSSLSSKTDILKGDEFWAVISAPDDPYNIYRKSNSVIINNVP